MDPRRERQMVSIGRLHFLTILPDAGGLLLGLEGPRADLARDGPPVAPKDSVFLLTVADNGGAMKLFAPRPRAGDVQGFALTWRAAVERRRRVVRS
jgi:hypothetical protein